MSTNITGNGYNKLYRHNGEWRLKYRTTEQYTVGQTIVAYGCVWQVESAKHSKIGNVSLYTLIDKGKDADE